MQNQRSTLGNVAVTDPTVGEFEVRPQNKTFIWAFDMVNEVRQRPLETSFRGDVRSLCVAVRLRRPPYNSLNVVGL